MEKPSYTVTVENRTSSSDQQSYVIFCQPPQITGAVQGRIWPIVVSRINIAQAQTGTFKIMSRYYQAFCGVADKTLAPGVDVVANNLRAVSLGDKKMDGSRKPGTTLSMAVSSRDVPEFPRSSPLPSAGVGAFDITTSDDFTSADAKNEHYVLGYGVYPKAVPRASLAACFVPEPKTKYQIKPSHTYFVACGAFEAGTLIDPDTITSICKVDFDSLKGGALTASIVHDEKRGMWVR